MQTVRCFAAAALLAGSSACIGVDYSISVGLLETASTDGYYVPLGYQVGDTVDFVAIETDRPLIGVGPSSPNGSSAKEPGRYTWRSLNPDIAESMGQGRFRMLQLGDASLLVETNHADFTFNVRVVPRVAAVRISPRSVTARVGDSIAFVVNPVDAAGNVLTFIKETNLMAGVHPGKTAAGDFILSPLSFRATSPYSFRVLRPGDIVVEARLSVYRARHLRDTAFVVVR